MSLFKYTATDLSGKAVHGKEVADDSFALIQRLREKNLYCTSYTQVEEKTQAGAKYKLKTKDLTFISRQLSTMLASGISLVKALNILCTQQEDKRIKKLLMEVYEDVQKGKSFSEAINYQKDAFPNLFKSMVAAGESSGTLDMIMTRVADHYANENKLHNTIKGALTYPIILGVIMVVVVILLFTFVMPMFAAMFDNQDEIPGLTRVMLGISNSMTTYWYLYIGVVVGIVLLIRILLRVPTVRYKFDKVKCRMPKVGKLMCTFYTARFARTMSNLFASGLQMVECIQKSVQVLGNAYISKEFETVIENVKQGESLSNAVAKTGVFDGIFTSIIFVGEESGTLDSILAKSADFYDEEADTAIKKLVSLLEPLMIVVLGGAVAMVLGAVFPALYASFGQVA